MRGHRQRQAGTDSPLCVCTGDPLEGEAERGWLPGTIKRLFNRLIVYTSVYIKPTMLIGIVGYRYIEMWKNMDKYCWKYNEIYTNN